MLEILTNILASMLKLFSNHDWLRRQSSSSPNLDYSPFDRA